MIEQKRIIHIDMDSFFASVELARNPQWRNLPVVIGSNIGNKGIVTTANYYARKFGINSATPMFKAKKMCENLVIINSNMQLYKKASAQIAKILLDFSDKLDFVSIDEAFIDISEKNFSDSQAVEFVRQVRNTIYLKTGLTASAGMASNRILAKIASEQNKPNGEFFIFQVDEQEFIDKLQVQKISGVGAKLVKKLAALNIKTCGDLKNANLPMADCDKFLTKIIKFAKGEDFAEVEKVSPRKSISYETTFLQNITSIEECKKILTKMLVELNLRSAKLGEFQSSGIQIKLKFANLTQITREKKTPVRQLEDFIELLEDAWTYAPVRLLGVGYKLDF